MWLTLAHLECRNIQRRTPSNYKLIVHGCCLSWLPTVPLSAPGHRYSPITYVHNTRAEGVNGNCIRQPAIAVSVVSWAAANRRRRSYMECDSNVGCVTERDCYQTARCTAETAEHFESRSRRSAERSRSRRRPSCETAEQTAAWRTADRCRSQRRRNAETPEQSAARRSSDCMQRQRQQLKSAVPLSRWPKSSQNRAGSLLLLIDRPFCERSILCCAHVSFSPQLTFPTSANRYFRNFSTWRGFTRKRSAAMPIS